MIIRGFVGGVVGAVIGAAVWAAVAYFAHYEIGIIAWGIGLLAGVGVAAGAKDDTSAATGVMAACIALAGVAGGKYAAVRLVTGDVVSAATKEVQITDDRAMVYMADSIIDQAEAAGRPLSLPPGFDKDAAESLDQYPKTLADDVRARWGAMTPDAQAQYRDSVKATIVSATEGSADAIASKGFFATLSFWDLLWAVLAVGTAFKVGGGLDD